MNLKIDDRNMYSEEKKSKLSNRLLGSFLFTTIAALIGIYLLDIGEKSATDQGVRFFTLPWVLGAGQEIANGLKEFSGRTLEPVPSLMRFTALGAMLLTTVIGPTLFLFGIRERIAFQSTTRSPWRRSTASIAGGVVTISVVLMILLAALIQPVAFSSLRKAQAIQRDRDLMIQDLSQIAWDVFEYRILSKNTVGKRDGTVKGYALPPELKSTENGRYSVSVKQEQVEILACSMRYPEASIAITVDGKGRMSNWRYGGEFR